MNFEVPDHPDIISAERTGYPENHPENRRDVDEDFENKRINAKDDALEDARLFNN